VTTTQSTEAGPDQGPAFVMPDFVGDSAQLWLIRHGQTEWSRDGRHTGRTDVPLTERGEQQARALAPLLADLNPALVLTSPRSRAQRTAELAGLRVDAVDDDLAEWDYGDYEGVTTPQIHRTDPGWTVFTRPTPGGETAEQIRARVDRVLTRAADALRTGPVVLVAHGHISRVLGARWIGLSVRDGGRFVLGEAAPCILGAEHGTAAIRTWNRPNPASAPPAEENAR